MAKLNINPGQGYTPIIPASQYDVGRELEFVIYDGTTQASIPSGTSATMVGTKPSGLGFTEECTVSGNVVRVATTATMTEEAGHIPAELRLTYNGTNIGTANFIFGVEASPHPDDVTDGDAETARDLMTRATEAMLGAEAAADEAEASAQSAAASAEAAAQAGLDTTGSENGQVPTADGQGGWSWQNQQGGGGASTSDDVSNESSVSGSTVTDALNSLSGEIANLEGGAPTPAATVSAMVDTTKIYLYTGSETGYNAGHWYYYSGGQWVDGGQYGEAASMSAGVKAALLACFQKVAWIDENGQTYYDNLYNELYPSASLVSISAVYTQSGTVYDTDSLDDLKPDLVVTANYSDSTTETVTTYTLSGTLAEGTSTITVNYGGKTATFTVTVTSATETLQITWSGSGTDNTTETIDARSAEIYWELPYIEGYTGYASTATEESEFVKISAQLFSDAEATTSVGYWYIDTQTIEGSRTTVNKPTMPVNTEIQIAPAGYYVKITASKRSGFSSNATCREFLNSYANTLKLALTGGA